MDKAAFELLHSTSSRIAKMRAIMTAKAHGLDRGAADDLQQDALLELWSKRARYDARHGSWRTFAECVVTNRLRTVCRTQVKRMALSAADLTLSGLERRIELQIDVAHVLSKVSPLERAVATFLMDCSATETSRRLGISRAATYRVIGRLKVAFASAGFAYCKMQRTVRQNRRLRRI